MVLPLVSTSNLCVGEEGKREDMTFEVIWMTVVLTVSVKNSHLQYVQYQAQFLDFSRGEGLSFFLGFLLESANVVQGSRPKGSLFISIYIYTFVARSALKNRFL